MSIHTGTIGGDVGGHAVSISIELVVCDRCEEQYVHTGWEGEAREGARASGWHDPDTDGGEEDLCPECKRAERRGGGETVKRRTTEDVYSAAVCGEVTVDQAERELAPYREAPLALPRTRWAIVRHHRPWHTAAGIVIAACCRALGADWLTVACALSAVMQFAALRLVRVPVKIPADPSFEAWRDYVEAHVEAEHNPHSICGCERCGHGRLVCDPCDECGRVGLVP